MGHLTEDALGGQDGSDISNLWASGGQKVELVTKGSEKSRRAIASTSMSSSDTQPAKSWSKTYVQYICT